MNMEMNEYYENSALSQSKLKLLISDPSRFITVEEPELYFEEKKHFIVGSAVDFCLTQPHREFEEEYHVSNLENKPSDTIKSIVNQVFDKVTEQEEQINLTLFSYEEVILECCNEHGYQSRWNDETRINKVCEAWEYWEDLIDSRGKQVLSQEEKDLIDTIVMSIRTCEATSKYFNKQGVSYQVPIYFEYMDVDCKALLDMIIIDEENKSIQPIDIKTMGDKVIYFPQSLRKRRYDIQAAFYVEGLKYLYPEYKILPFKFIVESTVDPGNPLVFTCDETLLNIGKHGRGVVYLEGDIYEDREVITTYYHRTEEIKGFSQLVELYKYYTENGFDKDQIVRENNSELNIDWSGIIV